MTSLIYRISNALSTATAFWLISMAGSAGAITAYAMGAGEAVLAAINLSISIFTMGIAQANLVASRRQDLAIDLKLDTIIDRLPGDNAPVGAEKLEEAAIKAAKDEIEERSR